MSSTPRRCRPSCKQIRPCLCGCIAGAAPVEQIETWLAQTGFIDVRVTPQPESRELVASWAPGRGIENFVASATVEARKPGGDGVSHG